ncbi:hypothetical protein PHLGIDRAFT_350665 [Phlebiopsis gigantea 11061_1 CR5-6]|uniref:G-protein coupled receptors family 1 profile domain-containing protein n=1 Tax=Phlebiopsis gigantea (strain 11061_1 CR5-6) TaxID=745531 RepID=A0A0C3S1J8_PHLG1|nr:hypothetical protein PHLGIDRAFT_350665 [Phlebiopsis gigantea 11061_1 CR5-6]
MPLLLDSDDQATLQSIGDDTIQGIVALCVESILWTTYLVLVIIAAKILLRRRRSTVSITIFIIILLMFLMDTAMYFIDINDALKEVSYTLTRNSDLSLPDRYALIDNLPFPVESALYAFMSNLGDVIVIWRVYAFYPPGRGVWVLVFPIALLIGSFVTSGLISFCVAALAGDTEAAGNFVHPPFCKNVQLASYCTSLATTGVATLLIAFKTWRYRRTVGRHLQETSSKRTRVERVAALLIESGILYFLFFLEAVVEDSGNIGQLEESTVGLEFASTIWTYMTSHILGIYPALIVILVHSQRSYIETVTTLTAHSIPSRGSQAAPSTTRLWNASHAGSSTLRVPPIEVDVTELRKMHGSNSWHKAVTDEGDESSVLERGPRDVKPLDGRNLDEE